MDLVERIEELIEGDDLPRYLYHGTSRYQYLKMEDEGFRTDLMYLADSPDGTDMYALGAVENDEMQHGIDELDNAVAILKLDVSRLLRLGELMPDWDDVQSNIHTGLFPDASTPSQVSWIESLEKLGTCSYKGRFGSAISNVEIE